MKLRECVLITAWLLLLGCQTKPPTAKQATAMNSAPAAPASQATALPTALAAVTQQQPPQMTAIPTKEPAAIPSPTTLPAVALAVPPGWLDPVQEAVSQAGQVANGGRWQIIAAEDPGQLLAQGAVDLALIAGDGGRLVSEEAKVLAVPFVTPWEGVSEAEADEILANGHSLATLMKWDEMPHDHKALRVGGRLPDDPGYALTERWSLVAASGYDRESGQLAAILRADFLDEPLVKLAAVGDLMLDRSLGNAIRRNETAFPFALVADQLEMADVTVGNLESSLGDLGQPAKKHYTFQAPPLATASLAAAGFDVVSLANNHAMDFGPEALLQGISRLEAEGIVTVGAGSNSLEARQARFLHIHDLTLAFLSYVNVPVEVGGFDTASWTATADAPGLAWGTGAVIKEDVAAAAKQADLVIVLLHSGLEYVAAPSEAQVEAARAAIEAGSQLVISHHSHILQGIEFYGEGVILYGVGNFAFQIEGDPQTAIFNIWLDRNGVRQIEIVPAIIQPGGQPRIALPDEAWTIRQQVYQLTALLNSQ
jgi:poly-gamma-glutamate capsule biosynthesis protein CapA/YwtB (metallophosphatase superfamily)